MVSKHSPQILDIRNIANHFLDLVDGADFLLTRLGGGVVGAAS